MATFSFLTNPYLPVSTREKDVNRSRNIGYWVWRRRSINKLAAVGQALIALSDLGISIPTGH